MKKVNMKFAISCLVSIFAAAAAFSQGTVLIDQESGQQVHSYGGGFGMQNNEPLGQSFTPSLSSVEFVTLLFTDLSPSNGLGATVYVNLLGGSITGPVLGTTAPVSMPDSFGYPSGGYETFYFPTPISVTPGTSYYFNPVVQSGDTWGISSSGIYQYNGGELYANGVGYPGVNLWFQEGIVVPEPSSSALLLCFGAAPLFYLFYFRRSIAPDLSS